MPTISNPNATSRMVVNFVEEILFSNNFLENRNLNRTVFLEFFDISKEPNFVFLCRVL